MELSDPQRAEARRLRSARRGRPRARALVRLGSMILVLLAGVACFPPTSIVGLADPVPAEPGTVRAQVGAVALGALATDGGHPSVFPALRVEVPISATVGVAANAVVYDANDATGGLDAVLSTERDGVRFTGRIGAGLAYGRWCPPSGCSHVALLGLQSELDVARTWGAWTPYGFVGANPMIDTSDPGGNLWVYGTGGVGAVWRPVADAPVRIGGATGLLLPADQRPLWAGGALYVAADLGRER